MTPATTTSNLKLRIWKFLWPLRAWWQGGLDVGSIFPNFTLSDALDGMHSLSSAPEQKLTVLWFTNFCDDCRSKIPLLANLLKDAGGKYRVLAISILPFDAPLPRQIAQTCPFPVLLDPQDIVTHKLGLAHPPNTCPIHNLFIVDFSGRVLYRRHLSALDQEEFNAVWQRLLNEPDSPKNHA